MPASDTSSRSDDLLYLDALLAHYDRLTLPIGAPAPAVALEAVYQPLRLRHDPLAAEDEARARRQRELTGPASASTNARDELAEHAAAALARTPRGRLVILGGPGTGKTTALKELLRQAAHRAREDAAAPLPIFISLPDFARAGRPLSEYLVAVVTELGVAASFAARLDAAITSGRASLCLDSLDEVAPAQRPDVITFTNREALRCGGIWIVGSRFAEYKGGQFAHSQFAEWELQPLDDTLRLALAQRLLPALRATFAAADAPSDPTPDPLAFVQALAHHPRAAAWGENPLLFSLAAAIFAREGALPATRAALYGTVIDAIVRMRTPDDGDRAMLREVLGELALHYHQIKGRSFTGEDLRGVLPQLCPPGTDERARIALAHQVIGSGVLDVVAADTYRFRHQTFQEYLAGAALAARLLDPRPERRAVAWDLAWSKRTYGRWVEVLRLLVGILTHEHGAAGGELALRWVEALLLLRDSPDGDVGALGLALALASLGELDAQVLPPGVTVPVYRRAVVAQIAEIADGAYQNDYERQQVAARLAHDLESFDEEIAALALDTALTHLGTSGSDAREALDVVLRGAIMRVAPEALLPLATHPDVLLRQLLLSAAGARQDPRLVPLYVAALRDPDYTTASYRAEKTVVGQAERVLGALGEAAPVELLRPLLSDARAGARVAAATLLRQRVPDAELLPLLADAEADVRKAALTALGEALPLETLQRLFDDSAQAVRAQAISLAGNRLDEATLRELLRDPEWGVRAAALRALDQRAPASELAEALRGDSMSLRDIAQDIAPRAAAGMSLPDLAQVVAAAGWRCRDTLRPLLEAAARQAPLEELLPLAAPGDETVRQVAQSVLAEREDATESAYAELLRRALAVADTEERVAALRHLQPLAKRLAPGPLVAALDDPERAVRAAAMRLLAGMDERMPIEPVVAALRDPRNQGDWDEDIALQETALGALARQHERAPMEPLLEALDAEWVRVRMAASYGLSYFGDAVPLSVLLAALDDVSPDVWIGAIRALARRADAPIERLTRLSWNPQPSVRNAVASSLGTRLPLEDVLRLANDPVDWVASVALSLLPRFSAEVPTDTLVQLAAEGRNERVRAAAVQMLAARGAEASIEPFVHALDDRAEGVRQAALTALRDRGPEVSFNALLAIVDEARAEDALIYALETLPQYPDIPLVPILKRLTDSRWGVEQAARRAVVQLGDRLSPELMADVFAADTRESRAQAVSVLALASPSTAQTALLRAAEDPDPDIRASAISALDAWGPDAPKQVVEVLRTALDDPDTGVVRSALRACAALGRQAPASQMARVLRHDYGPAGEYLGVAAVHALALIDAPAALSALVEATYSDWFDVQAAALNVLGQAHHPTAFRALLQHQNAYDDAIRDTVASALANFGAQAVDPLMTATRDRSDRVRIAALQALDTCGAPVPVEVFVNGLGDQSESVRRISQGILRQRVADLAPETLLSLLTDARPVVRAGAAAVATALGPNAPRDALVRLRDDADARVRDAAAASLDELDLRASLQTAWASGSEAELMALMRSPEVQRRRNVVDTLVERAVDSRFGALEAALDDADPQVRARALVGFAKRAGAGLPVPVDHICDRLADGVGFVRAAAVQALGALGTAMPPAPVLPLLTDSDENARHAAIHALGGLGEQTPTPALVQALRRESRLGARDLLNALARLDPPPPYTLFEALMADEHIGPAAIQALAHRGRSLPPALFSTVLQLHPVVAARQLAQIDPEAIAPLITEARAIILEGKIGPHFIQQQEIATAQHIGDLRIAAPPLLAELARLLNSPAAPVRTAAIRALGMIRRSIPDAALRRLLDLRRDSSPYVAAAADAALRAILSLENGIEDDADDA